MCSVHNHLGRDHYARCALRPKSQKDAVRIHCVPTSPVSSLTARIDLRWTVVVSAHVAACVLRIDDINIASTTVYNVGTITSFKDILAAG